MSLTFGRFEAIFLSKLIADAYGLRRQDAFRGLTVYFDLGFPMLLGHLTLRPFVLNGLEASQTGSNNFREGHVGGSTPAGNH